MGWTDIPYPIANLRVENGPAQAHFRIGWLRSVSNIYHAFAVQSFTDELAAAAGRDRVEYLLDIIGQPRVIDFGEGGSESRRRPQNPKFPFDTRRLRNVIELAAQKSGWANKKPGAGRALGIAAHRSFLTYVAVVAEVEVGQGGALRIPRIDIALDPGLRGRPRPREGAVRGRRGLRRRHRADERNDRVRRTACSSPISTATVSRG